MSLANRRKGSVSDDFPLPSHKSSNHDEKQQSDSRGAHDIDSTPSGHGGYPPPQTRSARDLDTHSYAPPAYPEDQTPDGDDDQWHANNGEHSENGYGQAASYSNYRTQPIEASPYPPQPDYQGDYDTTDYGETGYYYGQANSQLAENYQNWPVPQSAPNGGSGPPAPFEPEPPPGQTSGLSRRRFIQAVFGGGAAIAGLGVATRGLDIGIGGGPEIMVPEPSTHLGTVTGRSDTQGELVSGALGGRVLVIVELAGGNDGLSTLVPYGNGTYYDVRPNMAIPEEEVLAIDDQVGLHPNLARIHSRGVALIEGIGSTHASQSHFTMVQQWDRGVMDLSTNVRSGFLARMTDTLADDSPLVGLSVGGSTPRFAQSYSPTLAISNPKAFSFLASTPDTSNQIRAVHDGFRIFAKDEESQLGIVGSAWEQLLGLGQTIGEKTQREKDKNNPMLTDGGDLGKRLSLASDLIAAGVGVRVIHAKIGGFDTHDNHRNRHSDLMSQLDASIDGFLTQVEQDGMSDHVLVATSSEFGRRVPENGNGLDHGAGSMAMVVGPAKAGRYGAPSPVGDLDGYGNLKPEVPFTSYLGTLAERWLGIKAGSIFADDPDLIDFL